MKIRWRAILNSMGYRKHSKKGYICYINGGNKNKYITKYFKGQSSRHVIINWSGTQMVRGAKLLEGEII